MALKKIAPSPPIILSGQYSLKENWCLMRPSLTHQGMWMGLILC